MRNFKTFLFLSCLIFLKQIACCQPVNDSCQHAINLDTLPVPAVCPSGMGATITLTNQTNIGATPSSLSTYQGCAFDTSHLPNDVWYTFTTSNDVRGTLSISVTQASFQNPQITLYLGNACGYLNYTECVSGDSGKASLYCADCNGNDLNWTVRVSGFDSTQNGTFDLNVRNDNTCCLRAANITTIPAPVNGTFAPGQTVTFCFDVTDWYESNGDYFHGVSPSFGSGWDTSSLVPGPPPASCDSQGFWIWYPHGVINESGVTPSRQWPAGYYYDTWTNGLDAGNSNGDGCSIHDWQFCMSINVKDSAAPGSDLSAKFSASSDAQSGSYRYSGCFDEMPVVFQASGTCGTGHSTILHTICQGDSFLFNGQYLTQAGAYNIDTIMPVPGCDTLIRTYSLAIDTPPSLLIDTVFNAYCTGVDNGEIVASATGGFQPYTYIWSSHNTGTSLNQGLYPGLYCLTVTDAFGCRSFLCDSVATIYECVWPGDADNNKMVDNNDLLPIGLGYDSIGAIRAVQSIVWQADSATDWTNYFSTYAPLVNFNHADCNGDGIINADDTLAIVQNFSSTHNKAGGISGLWRSGIPAIYAVASPDTVYAGDTLTVAFILGDTAVPVANFYGLAFTYNFDPLLVDPAFTEMYFYSSSWIGTSSDKISIVNINSSGQIKAAVTRIDHTTRSGNGIIATAKFRISSQSGTSGTYLNPGVISEVTAIDQHGILIPLNAGADTTFVKTIVNGIYQLSTETLHIQPNPAHDKVLITAGNPIRALTITDVMGQQVMKDASLNAMSKNVDISAFDSGIYFVEVKTDRGVGVAKLVIER